MKGQIGGKTETSMNFDNSGVGRSKRILPSKKLIRQEEEKGSQNIARKCRMVVPSGQSLGRSKEGALPKS